MNKMTIIWLSIVSVILLIVVTVLITLGASKCCMMRGGPIGTGILTEVGQGDCDNCTNRTETQEGKGMRKGQGLMQSKDATVKDTTTTTTVVPTN